jgi:hypothetical protein
MKTGKFLLCLGFAGMALSFALSSRPALGVLGPCNVTMPAGPCKCSKNGTEFCFCTGFQYDTAACAGTVGDCDPGNGQCYADKSSTWTCCGTDGTCLGVFCEPTEMDGCKLMTAWCKDL